MIRNYFKIAWRNLWKNKFYSMINIAGLALGMFCSLLIWFWVKDEMSYDRFYPGYEDIYFVRCNSDFNGKIVTSGVTPSPLAEALKKDVPQVAFVTKLAYNRDLLINFGEKAGKENGLYASDDFFDVFRLTAIAGNPKEALTSPDHIVITRNVAEKYFRDISPLGKTIRLNNHKDYTVGAVIENIPSNSTVQLDWVINFKETEQEWMQLWGNTMLRTYVRLHPEATPENAETNMKGIYPKYADMDVLPILQPLKDVRLYSDYKNGKPSGGGIEYIRIFMIVALFILAIACINFMNMATARSSLRAKEVGIRKVVGAGRNSLFKQFISESILTSLLGLLLALGLVKLMLPAFSRFLRRPIEMDITDPTTLISIIALLLITGFLSGSYPALYLSAISPIHNLKNKLKPGFLNAAFLRKSLVVFQFTLSIFLIINMIVINGQMQYMRSENLGLDRERVLSIPLEGELYNKMEPFKQEVLRSAAIENATTSAMLPIDIGSSSGDLSWPGKDPDLQTNVSVMHIGYDFIKTMNIELAAGRDFSKDFRTDTLAYLINESTAELMGMEDPVGKQISFWNGEAPVIGMMKDFHIQSLHMPITPLVLCLDPQNSSQMLVKTRAGKTAEAIQDLEKLTRKFNPNYPFEYHFLDTEYEKLYRTDTMISTLIRYFGILAMVISVMGLLALAAFTAEQRTKEIGIRKVLGASVTNIVTLLSGNFTRLVLISIVIASPVAWYTMHRWLNSFAYSIELQWWMFILAGSVAILIAGITVSAQSIKAATANPVKSLRSE
ncbi:ABC transporter permease [Sinomicrobium sp. M5D2P9]